MAGSIHRCQVGSYIWACTSEERLELEIYIWESLNGILNHKSNDATLFCHENMHIPNIMNVYWFSIFRIKL